MFYAAKISSFEGIGSDAATQCHLLQPVIGHSRVMKAQAQARNRVAQAGSCDLRLSKYLA
jgi:hypothetical protein